MFLFDKLGFFELLNPAPEQNLRLIVTDYSRTLPTHSARPLGLV